LDIGAHGLHMTIHPLAAASLTAPFQGASSGWSARRAGAGLTRLLPGVLLCAAVSGAAFVLQSLEARLLGRAWLETLVIAILLGAMIRTSWSPPARWAPGVEFSGKILLEVAIVLLGVTVSVGAFLAAGPALILGIAGVVVFAIVGSYGLGRVFGLPHRMATLIACGNAICGNSAIAAIAPAIGAQGEDIAASIAFTAVLGVGVVLGLPILAAWLSLSPQSFGVFAGLTVYAVPQVLAATAPVSSLSAQVGTLVKLVRVLMLGPVVLIVSLLANRFDDGGMEVGRARREGGLKIHHLVPWFIVGFLAMMALRSSGWIPAAALAPASQAAKTLTIVSMSALGLGVDVRVVARAGVRVTSVVVLSIAGLGVMALLLIHVLGLR